MEFMLQTTQTEQTAIASRSDTAGPLAVATPITRQLAEASISVNTQRAYAGALRRLDAWRGGGPINDALLAVYLGELFEAGRAPATAALAVAAVRFRAKLAGQPDPAGEATARVLGGYRRTAADRGRGQAAPLSADGLAAILATAERPRTDGRGVESHTTAQRRGRTDAAIAGLLFMGGLRRSEVGALEWRDVTDATDGGGVLVTVRTSKTNQEGNTADVRFLKNGAAAAIRTLRTDRPDALPTDRVIGLSPATDSTPLHRRRPRCWYRGALDGAQWPGWARVRADGARRLDNRSHAWPGTGKPPAWSLTTRPARPPNAGPSPSICRRPFLSAPPCGGRRQGRCSSSLSACFYPRPRAGGDTPKSLALPCLAIPGPAAPHQAPP